jgi:hypothetical protein
VGPPLLAAEPLAPMALAQAALLAMEQAVVMER